MTDIDSNIDANERSRMDQDNQKNVKTPKPGGNREGANTQGNEDADEGDHAGRNDGDEGPTIDSAEVLERDKRNP